MKAKALFSLGVLVFALNPNSQAATWTGGDWGGGSLVVNNGDVLSGNFYNVGSFTLSSGAIAFVQPGSSFELHAGSVTIDGILEASGSGFSGAPAPSGDGANGLGGFGPGGGAGGQFGPAVHASGGGGGGFGGVGGNSGQSLGSPPFAPGGPGYGNPNDALALMGSGGGSGGNHGYGYTGTGGAGGSGGGSISIFANTFALNAGGGIFANGMAGSQGTAPDYSTSGGGGGSGGGISITAAYNAYVNGYIVADGGGGADFAPGQYGYGYGQGGGGGAGGRIYINAGSSFFDVFTELSVDGGFGGLSDTENMIAATGGQTGTIVIEHGDAPVPEAQHYATMLGFALAGAQMLRRKRKA